MALSLEVEEIKRLWTALETIPELKRRSGTIFWIWKVKWWRRNTWTVISKMFGRNSRQIKKFEEVTRLEWKFSEFARYEAHLNCLESATPVLESMIEELIRYGGRLSRKEVFVIHGRDNETKTAVSNFLRELGLKPVILDEQLNQGQTVIEKLEQSAQVGFAVALFTPDDIGSLQSKENTLTPRARQNVIFELGYFIRRLGRKRVCALTKGRVEIPSDYAGVVYIPLDDSEGWKQRLLEELKSAGLEVN